MKPLTRRSVTTGLAAAVTVIPAVGLCKGAESDAELASLIEQHKAAYVAFDLAIDREEVARQLLRKGEPTVASGLGSHYSLYQGEQECRRLIAAEWRAAREHLRQTRRVVTVADEAEAIVEARETEAMARIVTAFADYNAVKDEYDAADAAERDAWRAICAYRCQTPEGTRMKVEYLVSQPSGNPWGDDAKAVLKSLV